MRAPIRVRGSEFPRLLPIAALTLLGLVTPHALLADTWKMAIAQVAAMSRPADGLQKMLRWVDKVAAQKCRIVVFPEGTLRGVPDRDQPETRQAMAAIGQAAARHRIYIIAGIWSQIAGTPGGYNWASPNGYNWMIVSDPEGREVFSYNKLYDHTDGELPHIFHIDGVPCNTMICADRWLRAVEELPIIEGAQVSFELSNNFRTEWVAPLEWFWYVPRALRNNAYVVFANGAADPPELTDKHGHSAVIDPQGHLVAAARDDKEQLIIAEIDPSRATRAEAERRRNHPAIREFWEKGILVRDGRPVKVPAWKRYESPAVEIKIAAAQMAVSRNRDRNVSRMERMIGEAAAQNADVILFPELAVTGTDQKDILAAKPADLAAALRRIQTAARTGGISVVFGMPNLESMGKLARGNAAYVIGPNGETLTRYDQMVVDRRDLFEAGACPARMWFRVKGVPAVVTVGRDVLWNEISEMAAFAGAQLLFNIGNDAEAGSEADLRRMQVAAVFASFCTFSAFVNTAGGTSIWNDLHGIEEVRAVVKHTPVPDSGETVFVASFAANCVVKAGRGERIVYATRKVNQRNTVRSDTFNTRMKPWYSLGAHTITGCFDDAGGTAALNPGSRAMRLPQMFASAKDQR
jgi:predicted amidohydrolase